MKNCNGGGGSFSVYDVYFTFSFIAQKQSAESKTLEWKKCALTSAK